jgi:hypothetical protein
MASRRALSRIAEIPGSHPVFAALGLAPEPLHLRRAWPWSPTQLTLEYRSRDGVVAGHWHRDAPACARAAEGELLHLVALDGEQLVLQTPGTDPRLRGLAPALRRPEARLISHRAERRATVAVPGAFVTLVPTGRVAALARAQRAVDAVTVAPVLEEDELGGTLVLGALAGRPLHDLLGGPRAAGAIAAAAAAVRALHEQPLPDAVRKRRHGPDEEAAVLAGWLERLLWHEPALYARIGQRARRVIDDLAAMSLPARRLIHRDLHDKQILVGDDGTVSLIGLDGLSAGDPALDLANLAAHFELRALQSGAPGAGAAARAALLDGYGASIALRRRAEVYERAALVRLACVYAFRPRWARVAVLLAADPSGRDGLAGGAPEAVSEVVLGDEFGRADVEVAAKGPVDEMLEIQ